MDSINPEDFVTFTREAAIKELKTLEDDEDFDEEDCFSEDYNTMTNEELEAELCLAGFVHDEDMKGVFDTKLEADDALKAAIENYS
jgi:hypothetical protein